MEKQTKFPFAWGNSNLYESDYDSLREGQWLTSEAINISLLMLRQQFPAKNVRLLDPYFVSMLLFEDEEEEVQKIVDLRLFDNQFVMLPLNTNSDWAGQGDHWTLAVLHPADRSLHVLDSTGKLIDNVEVLRNALERIGSTTYNKQWPLRAHMKKHVPKQSNSSDCGIYVIGYVEALLRHFQQQKSLTDEIDWRLVDFRSRRKLIRESIDKLMLHKQKAHH